MAIRFQFIRKKKDGSNFISMYDFYNSIEKKNLIDEQRKLSPFNDQLDLFYICLLVGLNNNLKANENDFVIEGFHDSWTKSLKSSGAKDYILGLFLSKITNEFKEDKYKIKQTINEVLDNESDTNLSDAGMKKLHSYCFGGYLKILEELEYKTPSNLVKFFNVINKLTSD